MRNSHKHNLKRITLELGGKSPNIVLDDADLDLAVQQSHNGLFFNAGQCCNAGTRIFVQEGIYDEFVKRSVALASKINIGDPFEQKNTMGPLIDKIQMDKVIGYIKEGEREGAKWEIGGKRLDGKGYFV